MKTVKTLIILGLFTALATQQARGQGWAANVIVDLNHSGYAFEKVSSATVTYSGATAHGSSSSSSVQLTLHGTGSITGQLSASASGLAWEPYDRTAPYSTSLSRSLSGNVTPICTTGYLESVTQTSAIRVYITVYPRLVISTFSNDCNQLSFSTSSCSPVFSWDVSDNPFGPFKVIPGKQTSSITVSREELAALGFDDPYGRKYFRVTGYPGTTSEMQAMDVYYPPPTAILLTSPPKCMGSADGSLTVEIASANPGVINDFVVTLFSDAAMQNSKEQQFINDRFTTTFGGLAAGNYWVRIENNSAIGTYGNCWADYPVPQLVDPSRITIVDIEAPEVNGFNIRCSGGHDGMMRVRVSGGTGYYPWFQWTPPVSASAFGEYLGEGTYQVRAQDSNGCWSETVTRTLSAPEALTVQMISAGGKNGFDVSCLDKSDGSIATEIRGGVPAYSYAWSTGVQAPTLANVGPGAYTLTVTDANACRTSSTITLSAPEAIDFTIAEVSGITCPNDDSGVLEIQSTRNTIGEVYYAWSSGEFTKDVRNKSSGTYTATVSDGQGCSATKPYILAEPAPWSLDLRVASDFNGTPIRCHGDDNGVLEMLVQNGDGQVVQADNYIWYRNGAEWASGREYSSLDGLTAGTYKGVITYNVSCTLEETITLNEPESMGVAISSAATYNGKAISCSGASDGALQATAAGGTGGAYTYEWNNGSTGPKLSEIGAGAYSVIARDINGCEASAEKFVEEPEPVRASIAALSDFNGQAISCTGAADARLRASPHGGTSPYSYLWNTGGTGAALSDVSGGTYHVNVTDINGCEGIADIIVPEPAPVKARISDQSDYNGFGVSCNGSEDGYLLCSATGGTGEYFFNWAGSHTQPLYENLPAGIYSVVVTDQNGCASTMEATVSEPPQLSLTVAGTQDVRCFGASDGVIHATASGGAGTYLYAVDNRPGQTLPTFSKLKAGSHLIRVSDVNHCTAQISQTLTEPPPLTIAIDRITNAVCGKANGAIAATVTGGTKDYVYQWTNTENIVISDEANISGIPSGLYRLNIQDGNRCEAAQAVGITSLDGPEVSVAKIIPATCSYSQDGSAEVAVTAGHGPFSVLWEDGQIAEKAINLKGGNYFVTVSDRNECTAVTEVTIPAPDSLQARLIASTEPTCHGDCNGRLEVAASGGDGSYSFQWDTFNGAELVDICAGTYTVTVTDGRQCASTASFTLQEPDPVNVILKQSRDPVCHDACDGQLRVEGAGGTGTLHYRWSTGDTDSLATSLCPGSYTVTVTDDNTCASVSPYTLTNPPGESLNLGGSVTLCTGQQYTLDAGPQWREYAWSANNGFSSPSQRVTISEAGMYWVTATNNKGCIAQDTFLLETSKNLLHANFLMTTEAIVMDTVVVIDISWPLPETATWRFPEEMKLLQNFGDVVFGKFEEPGDYDVTLAATLGECRDEITKTVSILHTKEGFADGRLGTEPFVKEFTLYPNPNEGTFDVAVAFREPTPITLTVWSILTARKIGQITDDGKERYETRFDLRPLPAGPYSIRLDYRKGSKYIRFIVR